MSKRDAENHRCNICSHSNSVLSDIHPFSVTRPPQESSAITVIIRDKQFFFVFIG